MLASSSVVSARNSDTKQDTVALIAYKRHRLKRGGNCITCTHCGKGGHTADRKLSRIFLVGNGKMGHDGGTCWTRLSAMETCTICEKRGHVAINYWSQGKVKEVKLLLPDSFYNIPVAINNQYFDGYVDKGSQVNVAHISVAKKLTTKIPYDQLNLPSSKP